MLGGGGLSLGRGGIPPMVRNLIIINATVYLLSLLYINWVPPVGEAPLLRHLLLWAPDFFSGKIWQPVTYMFLHSFSDIFHILFNMFVLWMFGSIFEARYGSKKFLRYYLICGLGGGVAVLLCHLLFPNTAFFNVPVLGASAAVLGLVVAFGVNHPNAHVYLFFVIPIKGRYIPLAVVVGDILINFMGARIASHAHLGGMLTGWLLLTGYWHPQSWRRLRDQWQFKRRHREMRRRFKDLNRK